jgi:hypothetical protein
MATDPAELIFEKIDRAKEHRISRPASGHFRYRSRDYIVTIGQDAGISK